jgi:uracil-DNA glycosylase family 4
MTQDNHAALLELYKEISVCPDCELSTTRTHAVPGEGRPDAEIVFIGEAPGYYEDQQARPFVGPAGQFLDQLLASIGMKRQDVYICNVIKCRPPSNRDPLPKEIQACHKWLERQLELIGPKVVATLGRYSLAKYFPSEPISRIHGQERRVGDVLVVPMYHPAAALHQGSLRRTIETDFKKLPAILERARQAHEPEQPKEPEPEQMRLF